MLTGNAWPPRSDHTVTPFNGQLVVIGGENYSENYTAWRDVWASADAVHWALLNGDPPFPPMAYHAVEVLGDTLVLTGGGVCVGPYITVCFAYDWYDATWVSADAVHWRQLSPAVAPRHNPNPSHDHNQHQHTHQHQHQPDATGVRAWTARGGHTLTLFNGALFLTGGLNNTHQFNDVWAFNGAAWRLVTAAAPWTERSFHQVVAFQGRLVLAGGGNMNGEFGDVWTSSDGAAWTLLTATPGWTPRCAHAMVEVAGALVLMAGMHNDTVSQLALTDVWASGNGGASWALQTATPSWGKRSFSTAAVWAGRVLLTGGWWFNWTGGGAGPDPLVPFTYVYYSDVWEAAGT
jgi:hypothetical protein